MTEQNSKPDLRDHLRVARMFSGGVHELLEKALRSDTASHDRDETIALVLYRVGALGRVLTEIAAERPDLAERGQWCRDFMSLPFSRDSRVSPASND